MIPALIIGRKGSVQFPNKNTHPVLGRPMCWYVMNNACQCNEIDSVWVSTDDEEIVRIAREDIGDKINIINRPKELCTSEALGEDVFRHGYEYIKNITGEDFDIMVLLFCNAVTFTASHITAGIDHLIDMPKLDSAITVSKYNWYAPMRARKIDNKGLLKPFVPFTDADRDINCDRDSQGDCYFADCCVSVIRTRNLENSKLNLPPQKWMGYNIWPIFNEGGLDIDSKFQLGQVEHYLRKVGW